jgi:hypothetical protein
MSRYRLMPREGSCTFHKIRTGKKWIGRVGVCEDGRFFGKIGSTFVYADSAAAAFDLVVSKHLGYANAGELRAHNSRVSAVNRQRRDKTRHAVNELMRGNFNALDALFGK